MGKRGLKARQQPPQKGCDLDLTKKYTGADGHPNSPQNNNRANHERQKEIQIPGQSTLGVERQSSKERDRVQASVWSKHEGELEKETLRRER